MSYSIQVVGYQPQPGVPLDDYPDFPVGRMFSVEETKEMAAMGHFPPGIILISKGGRPCVIRGHYHEEQTAEPLDFFCPKCTQKDNKCTQGD